MRAIPYKSIVSALLLIAVAGFLVFRWWQGPLLPSYQVSSMPLVQTVVATGRIVAVSRTEIGSEVAGVVLERLVQEGQQVAAGDLLLVLSADEITAQVRQAEAELAELVSSNRPQAAVDLANAEVALAQASRNVERRRELAAISAISDEEMEQAIQVQKQARNDLENARLKAKALSTGGVEEDLLRARIAALQAQLNKTQVRSKVSGTILTRNVEIGELVQPGQSLFTIALDGNTEIRVPLDERNLSSLEVEQQAVAIADAYPDKPFPVRISFIAPSIDPQRGTVEVRLAVDPIPEFLRQDMTVSVNIETDRRAKALVVPNDALANVKKDNADVLLLRNGKVQRQQLRLGLRGLSASEVLSGLSAGDEILVDATASLADGARVRTISPDEVNLIAPPVDDTLQLIQEDKRPQRLRSINNWQQITDTLDQLPLLTAVSPNVSGPGFVRRGEALESVILVGTDLERYQKIIPLSEYLISGELRVSADNVLIGSELAKNLGVEVGSKLRLDSGQDDDDSSFDNNFNNNLNNNSAVVNIAGIFELGVRELDARYVYLDLKQAQSLLNLPGGITVIDLTVEDIFEAEEIAAQVGRLTSLQAESWIKTNAQLLSGLTAQSLSSNMIVGFVAISVAFGIASVLSVSVVQRTREIGILRAMGATRQQILRIFLIQGAVFGLLGSIVGSGVSYVLVWSFNTFGPNIFTIPISINLILVTMSLATLTGIIAAAIPARRAAALDPVVAIRYV